MGAKSGITQALESEPGLEAVAPERSTQRVEHRGAADQVDGPVGAALGQRDAGALGEVVALEHDPRGAPSVCSRPFAALRVVAITRTPEARASWKSGGSLAPRPSAFPRS